MVTQSIVHAVYFTYLTTDDENDTTSMHVLHHFIPIPTPLKKVKGNENSPIDLWTVKVKLNDCSK